MIHRLAFIALLIPAAFAQINMRDNRTPELACGRLNYCEMREETVAATSQFALEGLHNGGVTILGSDRKDVLVRMRVEASTYSESAAKDLFKLIHTHAAPGRLTVDGPENDSMFGWTSGNWWSVSVEVFVPHKTDLRLDTHNGAIKISDIQGRIDSTSHNGAIRVDRVTGAARLLSHNGALTFSEIGSDVTFESHNGAVRGTRLGGSVEGSSNNGSVEIELEGAASASRRVDIESRNGRVTLGAPRSYSAHVQTESRNGRLSSDFPITVRGQVSNGSSRNGSSHWDDGDQDFNIGSGTGSIRLRTRNGGIRLQQL